MKKFIKATHENGDIKYINLNLVSTIKDSGYRYELNILGNIYYVKKDCKDISDLLND